MHQQDNKKNLYYAHLIILKKIKNKKKKRGEKKVIWNDIKGKKKRKNKLVCLEEKIRTELD